MNPNIDQFPMPHTATSGANMPGAEFGPANRVAEQAPSHEAAATTPQQPAVSTPPITPGPTIATQQNTSPATHAQAAPSMPVVDGTGEELQRKWVAVAKSIVERTKDNPFQQSLELNKAGKQYRAQAGQGVNPSED